MLTRYARQNKARNDAGEARHREARHRDARVAIGWGGAKPHSRAARKALVVDHPECFLVPHKLAYPVCDATGTPDCRGLHAAFYRARLVDRTHTRPLGYPPVAVAADAFARGSRAGCAWVTNDFNLEPAEKTAIAHAMASRTAPRHAQSTAKRRGAPSTISSRVSPSTKPPMSLVPASGSSGRTV